MPGVDEVLYEFGPVRIDTARMTLERDGEDVPIAPRAFDALLLLIQSRGQVVSKAELLSSIWPDTHVEEANLPVMISAIRRATGDDGRHQKYIQTVSKSGYRFVGEVKEISLAEEALSHPAEAARLSSQDPRDPACQPAGRRSLAAGLWEAPSARLARAAAVLAALIAGYWRVNGGAVAGQVEAAPRSVEATEKPGTPAASSSNPAAA